MRPNGEICRPVGVLVLVSVIFLPRLRPQTSLITRSLVRTQQIQSLPTEGCCMRMVSFFLPNVFT